MASKIITFREFGNVMSEELEMQIRLHGKLCGRGLWADFQFGLRNVIRCEHQHLITVPESDLVWLRPFNFCMFPARDPGRTIDIVDEFGGYHLFSQWSQDQTCK